VRYAVLAALAAAAVLSYLLRVSLATANTTVQRDLRLDDPAMGHLLSAFYLGYFWLQLPAGWLGHRVGARRSLTVMAVCWAGAMAVTAAAHSFGVLYASRVAQGMAQGGLFAVTIMALRDWFPTTRRGTASAVITSCMGVGAMLASGMTGALLGPLGWRTTFLSYALLAAGWAAAFAAFFRNTPDTHPLVNEAERELIRGDLRPMTTPRPAIAPAARSGSTASALVAMVRSVPVWLLCGQAFFQAFGFAFFITWFPTFLEKVLGAGVASTGYLAMFPLLGSVLGSILGGALIDGILVRTGRKWPSRCGLSAAGLCACAALLTASAFLTRPVPVVAVVSLAIFCGGLAKPAQWAATIDLTGGHSAVGFAIMNMAGNIGAYVCPIVVGVLMDRFSRSGTAGGAALHLIAGIHLAGAICWLLLDPARPAVGTGD
jgi:MFS family permease